MCAGANPGTGKLSGERHADERQRRERDSGEEEPKEPGGLERVGRSESHVSDGRLLRVGTPRARAGRPGAGAEAAAGGGVGPKAQLRAWVEGELG